MDRPYLVYKNNLDESGGVCPNDSDIALYLNSIILKFNYKFKTNVSFYHDEILEGEILKEARQIIYTELEDLLDNYHIDADPNGFGRSAMKVSILGRDKILNHFRNKIDQIIYSLDGLLSFFDDTIRENGRVEIYGLGDIDVIDWNIIWKVKSVIRTSGGCSVAELKKLTIYLFNLDASSAISNDKFNERITHLLKKGYILIEKDKIITTKKGLVVNVWANYVTKKITIKEPK